MRGGALGLLLLALVAPATVSAQRRSRVAASAPSPAAEAFRRGSEAFGRSEFDAALVAFREAFELQPHDSVRYNIAVCLERLGRLREALVEYESVARSEALDRDARAAAQSAADSARARLASVRLRAVAVIEASVDHAFTCSTPCEVVVDPGDHTVHFADGTERRFHVDEGGAIEIEHYEPADTSPPTEPVDEPPLPAVEAPTDSSHVDPGLGPLGYAGLGALALGGGAVIGFGVRTLELHGDYERLGCVQSICDDGALFRDLANASIGVAVAGALIVAVDLLFVTD